MHSICFEKEGEEGKVRNEGKKRNKRYELKWREEKEKADIWREGRREEEEVSYLKWTVSVSRSKKWKKEEKEQTN